MPFIEIESLLLLFGRVDVIYKNSEAVMVMPSYLLLTTACLRDTT